MVIIFRSTIILHAILLACVNGFNTPKCKFCNSMAKMSRRTVTVTTTTTTTTSSSSSSSFSTTTRPTTTTRLNTFSYGRGAEIWPATNEDAVLLSDTFPNGIPYSAIVTIEQQDMASLHEVVEESINGTSTIIDYDDDDNNDDDDATTTRTGGSSSSSSSSSSTKRPVGSKRKFVSRSIRRILRRAAAKEELDSEGEIVALDRTPILVAVTLLGRGLVRPLDVTLVAFLTTYLTILSMVARRPRESSGGAPILPAMPPQGHVPVMVSNPMGVGILTSGLYDAWLKVGVIVGFVGPILLLTRYILIKDNIAAANICSRPLFLLCCQAISESISRRVMAPLPLRIFVPIIYSTARLGYLWSWALGSAVSLGRIGRSLAIVNAVYWTVNLFAFLIPVASIRYMRAHFFGVEAAEVVTRAGMEETAGLISK